MTYVPNPATWFNQERYQDHTETWLPKEEKPRWKPEAIPEHARRNSCASPVHPDLPLEQDAIQRVRHFMNEAKNTKLGDGSWGACKIAREVAAEALPDDLKSWFDSEQRRQKQNAS